MRQRDFFKGKAVVSNSEIDWQNYKRAKEILPTTHLTSNKELLF